MAEGGYQTEYFYTGEEIAEPLSTNFTTNSGSSSFTFTWYSGSVAGDNKLTAGTRPSEKGSYVLVAETDNYTAGSTRLKIIIGSFVPEPTVKATLGAANAGTDGRYHGDVTVQAPERYFISTIQAAGSFTGKSFTVSGDQNADVTYYLKQDGTGYILDAMTIKVKIDTVLPTAEYEYRVKRRMR